VTDVLPGDESVDLATVTRDDALLDALGRGEAAPADDDVAAMLAAWRDDLYPVRSPAPPGRAAVVGGAPVRRLRPHRFRVVLATAAAVVALGGALAVVAADAEPGSPFWPITSVFYPDRAESRQAQQEAEESIQRAREAVAEGRYTDAERLLDEATVQIGRIRDEGAVERLLAEVAAIRGLLPGGPALPTGGPGATPTPGPTGGPGRQPGATPPPPTGGGLPLPTLPLPPLPTPSLPLPSLPLPSLPLPSPPLPTLPL
jgi:hypothetical protein